MVCKESRGQGFGQTFGVIDRCLWSIDDNVSMLIAILCLVDDEMDCYGDVRGNVLGYKP